MKNKHLWWIIPLALLLAALIGLGIYYLLLRGRALESRPLVLIQSPASHEQLAVGSNTVVQASARLDGGIRMMQLWVDGELVAENTAAGEEVNTLMTLAVTWMPQVIGEHTLTVTALSANGVSGQATIFVEGVAPAAAEPAVHEVKEGETLEEIAVSYGVTPDEIVEANESLGGAAPQAGDELTIPADEEAYSPPFDSWGGGGDEPADGESDAPAAGGAEEAPPAADEEPGSLQVMEIIWPAFSIHPVEPLQLQVEVQALQTRETYESVHCYVSLAGSTPLWVPDTDHDQATDESFESRAGGTEWNVMSFMAADNATRVTWEAHTALPIDISCVGIAGGGLDSVDLGRIVDEVPPEQWGIPQARRSEGGESQFNLAYLVTYPDKGLDPSIAAPYNVRLHADAQTLSWSYDGVVDGFAVLLNDQLQFTVDGSDREVSIPPQWFEAPCDTTFNFTVVAFYEGYPDGNYSDPSEPAVLSGPEPGDPECPLSIVLNFQVLNTGNLGNPVPASGHFMAQDERITFDGHSPGGDHPHVGLADNHGYIIRDLFTATIDQYRPLVLDLPYDDPENPYDSLQVGFELYDEGNRLACGGDLAVSAEDLKQDFTGTIYNEYPREDDPNMCVVTFGIAPILEGASANPLPDLRVEELTYDFARGFYRVIVRNTGQADWAGKDVVIETSNHAGDVLGRYTFPNVTIPVNEQREFQEPAWDWQPILDGCVLLDPENLVQERIDELVAEHILNRGPYCRPLSDFTIPEVVYDRATNYLGVTIRNEGEVTPVDTQLLVRVEAASGETFERTVTLTLEKYASDRQWIALSESEREGMGDGYTVTVNADGAVMEEDNGNNAFTVEGSKLLKIAWRQAGAWFCSLYRQWWGNFDNHWQFNFAADVVGGSDPQRVVGWEYEDLEIDVDDHLEAWCTTSYTTDWFEVGGDEELVISMSATMRMAAYSDRRSNGGSERLSLSNGFGGVTIIPMDMDPALYGHQVYTTHVSHAESCGHPMGAIGRAEPYDWEAGMHRWGPYYVENTYGSGHEDRDPCYWASTYMLYQAEEP